MALTQLSMLLDSYVSIFGSSQPSDTPALEVPDFVRRHIHATFNAAGDAWTGASEADRDGICRQIADLGGVLASSSGIKAGFAWDSCQEMHLALFLIATCSGLASRTGWAGSSSDLFRWLRCAGVLLTSGAALVREWADAAGEGPKLALEAALGLAGSQLAAMQQLLCLLRGSQASHPRTVAAFAASVAGPEAMLTWLAVMAEAMSKGMGAGCPLQGTPALFGIIAPQVLGWDMFARHQAALTRRHERAMAAVLPVLCRAALDEAEQQQGSASRSGGSSGNSGGGASSRSSSGGNSGGGGDSCDDSSGDGSSEGGSSSGGGAGGDKAFQLARCLFTFLSVPCLQKVLQTVVATSSGEHLFDVMAALLSRISHPPPEAGAASQQRCVLLAGCTSAWGRLCRALVHSTDWEQQWQQWQGRAVQQAVQSLPALASMAGQLQPEEGTPPATVCLQGMLGAATLAADIVHVQAWSADGWGEQARAAHLAGAVHAGLAAALLASAAPDVALEAVASCMTTAHALFPHSRDMLPGDPAEHEELCTQMRTLHAAACRLVYHHASARADGELEAGQAGGMVRGVQHIFSVWFRTNGWIATVGDTPSRQMQAFAAAHLSTVAPEVGQWEPGTEEACYLDSRHALVMAMILSGAATLASPWLRMSGNSVTLMAALRRLLAIAKAAAPGQAPSLSYPIPSTARAILAHAGAHRCAPLAAVLVSSGLLAQLVEGGLVGEQGAGHGGRVAAAVQRRNRLSQVLALHTALHGVIACLAKAVLEAAAEDASSPAAQVPTDVLAAAQQPGAAPSHASALQQVFTQRLLPLAMQLAAALEAHWQQPEQQAAAALELAQAVATRGCANLRCANLGAQGGPDRGQVTGSKRCSGCRAVRYCSTACQTEGWRAGGHRKVCAVLAGAPEAA